MKVKLPQWTGISFPMTFVTMRAMIVASEMLLCTCKIGMRNGVCTRYFFGILGYVTSNITTVVWI